MKSVCILLGYYTPRRPTGYPPSDVTGAGPHKSLKINPIGLFWTEREGEDGRQCAFPMQQAVQKSRTSLFVICTLHNLDTIGITVA